MPPYWAMDDLIKEYLLFRCFSSTLKSFEAEIKAEKEKGHRPDRIAEQMLQFISGHDLASLRDLWQELNLKLFQRLDDAGQAQSAVRLESGFLKLYLVNCLQTKSQDKVREFFEAMAPELQGNPEWRDWFSLPFLPNPESNPVFGPYFSRQWQDTLLLSLHNFLSLTFANLPPPKLADFRTTAAKLARLREENRWLRQTLADRLNAPETPAATVNPWMPKVPMSDDIMDDFSIIAQEGALQQQQQQQAVVAAAGGGPQQQGHPGSSQLSIPEIQVKSLTKFLRNITGTGSSPSQQQVKQQQQQQQQQLQLPKQGPPTPGRPMGLQQQPAAKVVAAAVQVANSAKPGSTPVEVPGTLSSTPSSSSLSSSAKPSHAPLTRIATAAGGAGVAAGGQPLVDLSQAGPPRPTGRQVDRLALAAVDLVGAPDGDRLRGGDQGGDRCDGSYILLSQEEYLEHQPSEVTQCRFSDSLSYLMASSDVGGAVKVWSASPGPPSTIATFLANSPVTGLEWLPGSDRLLLYGTASGAIRMCDCHSRRTTAEVVAPAGPAAAAVRQLAVPGAAAGSPQVMAAAFASGVTIYDLATFKEVCQVQPDPSDDAVTCCTFADDPTLSAAPVLISGTAGGRVSVHDTRAPGRARSVASWIAPGRGSRTTVRAPPDDDDVVVVVEDNLRPSTDEIATLQATHVSSNGAGLVHVLSNEGVFSTWPLGYGSLAPLNVWALDDADCVNPKRHPRSATGKQFAFAGDGQHLLACSPSGGVVYDVSEIIEDAAKFGLRSRSDMEMKKVLTLTGHRTYTTCADWSASTDCGPCVTAGHDGRIVVSTLMRH